VRWLEAVVRLSDVDAESGLAVAVGPMTVGSMEDGAILGARSAIITTRLADIR
jgi:hypothetical protein